MATAKYYVKPPPDIGKKKPSRAERLEGVPEQELPKVIKAFESQGAKVKATRDKKNPALFIVEAYF